MSRLERFADLSFRDNKLFESRLPSFTLTEKADGTCIQMWFMDPKRTFQNSERWIEGAKRVPEAHNEEIEGTSSTFSSIPSIPFPLCRLGVLFLLIYSIY